MGAQRDVDIHGSIERLRSVLDASGVVGTWDWDIVRRIARYDRGAAELLAHNPDLAGQDIFGEAAMCGVHPDDKEWLRTELLRSPQGGGIFLAEYRVITIDEQTRWLFSRGRIFQDMHGRPVRSTGILIDITEGRNGGRDANRGYVTLPAERHQQPLDRAASLLLDARKAIDEAGSEAQSQIRVLLDLALFEVGTQLARRSRH